jgi:hypothetical protein
VKRNPSDILQQRARLWRSFALRLRQAFHRSTCGFIGVVGPQNCAQLCFSRLLLEVDLALVSNSLEVRLMLEEFICGAHHDAAFL